MKEKSEVVRKKVSLFSGIFFPSLPFGLSAELEREKVQETIKKILKARLHKSFIDFPILQVVLEIRKSRYESCF